MKFKYTETESFYQFGGRDPNKCGKIACCGNLDWYLGAEEYAKACPGSIPPAFENASEYYATLQENFQSAPREGDVSYAGSSEFEKQDRECKATNKDWSAAYNPMVCTEGINYVPMANCKCVDKQQNCSKCFKAINPGQYQVDVFSDN